MQLISGNKRDLGDGFSVSRIIPQATLRSLGPFVFFDYFGPAKFAPGKGLDVRILDHNVSLARLTGANKQQIEEGIPHIASLMCDDETLLLEHAEALVVTNSSEETARLVADAAPGCTIVDLTQGALPALHAGRRPLAAAWERLPLAAQSVH